MPDPFTPSPHRNQDNVPCWLVRGHRSVCEVHPADRSRTNQPCWSPDFLVTGLFTETAADQWRRENGVDPITGEPV